MADNVVLIKFEDSAKAFELLSKFKSNSDVRSAAVVEVGEDRVPAIKDGFDSESGGGTAIGGLIGMTIGILGGPLGMLLGLGTGGLIGAASDAGDTSDSTGVVARLVDDLPPGTVALIAHAIEGDPSVIDIQSREAGGVVERHDSADLLNDLYAAEEQAKEAKKAERKAEKEARKEEKEAAKAARKDRVDTQLNEFSGDAA